MSHGDYEVVPGSGNELDADNFAMLSGKYANQSVDLIAELRGWWETTSSADFEAMVPKVGEYTASDLVLMGQFMEHWLGLPKGSGQEAACLFYALGKVARAVAAYKEGRLPSADTLHDLVVYGMMARRIRERGGWPGPPQDQGDR